MQGLTWKLCRESWDSAFARGMQNPVRVLIVEERKPGSRSRMVCRHRFFIAAGDSDYVDVCGSRKERAVYVISRNPRYGYCGVERFDLDGDGEAVSLFEQNNPAESFGRNWEDARPAAIVRRLAQAGAFDN